eukprot:m.317501 g.317501  ORF g.317501 m.317501 type:complete len:69 (-) comp16508_c0_seq2:1112-1318(-)
MYDKMERNYLEEFNWGGMRMISIQPSYTPSTFSVSKRETTTMLPDNAMSLRQRSSNILRPVSSTSKRS